MNITNDPIVLFREAQPFFIGVGDEHRQTIVIMLLKTQKLSVNEIAKQLPLSRPAVSHHLKILADTGLVTIEKQGTQRFYMISESASTQLDLLEQLVTALRNCTHWKD